MKKIYATLFVAALGASASFAQAPTLKAIWTKAYEMNNVGEIDNAAPNWSNKTAIKATPGMINAVGVGSKLYAIDQTTMSVVAFDKDGSSKAYDLPSLEGRTVKHIALADAGNIVESPDFYGSLISCDDAGHLLIGHAQGTGASNNYWTVLDLATGATKHLDFQFSNYNACLPLQGVSRALGDVTKEGYLYVGPTSIFWPEIKTISWVSDYMNVQLTKMFKFTGDGTVAGASVTGELSGAMPLGTWVRNYCAPLYSSVEDMKAAMASDPTNVTLAQTFFLYSKQFGTCGSINTYGAMVGTIDPAKAYSLIAPSQSFTTTSDLTGINWTQYNAFDTFELGGERYYVAAFEDDEAFKNEGCLRFAVFDADGYMPFDGECEWSYDGNWSDPAFEVEGVYNTSWVKGSMTINVEKVDDENVNIYVWAQSPESGVVAGMFNYGNGNIGNTGVNDVAVEGNNEAPVYYNLNGVRVENPANGIFIEKRGNKAVKVVK